MNSRSTTLRILALSRYFCHGYGGAPESILLLARSLKTVGIAVDVISDQGFYRDIGELEFLPNKETVARETQSPAIVSGYTALLIVGAWNFKAFIAAIRARLNGVKVLYAPKGQLCACEFRSFKIAKKLLFYCAIEFWTIMLSDRLLFTSELERRATLLPGWIKRRKGVVLPEPFIGKKIPDIDETRDVTEVRLGFVAQVSRRKGLRELVDGFLLWQSRESTPKAMLSIAGTPVDGADRYWQRIDAKVKSSELGRRVEFLGHLSDIKREAFYLRIDVLVAPSFFESFSLVVAEALWHGKPVITGSDLGILEFVEKDTPVIRLPEISADAIAETLAQTASDFDPLSATAKKYRNRTLAALTQETVAAQYVHLLNSI